MDESLKKNTLEIEGVLYIIFTFLFYFICQSKSPQQRQYNKQ